MSQTDIDRFRQRCALGQATMRADGFGHLVADLILGRPPIAETKEYRLARFGQSQWGKVAEF